MWWFQVGLEVARHLCLGIKSVSLYFITPIHRITFQKTCRRCANFKVRLKWVSAWRSHQSWLHVTKQGSALQAGDPHVAFPPTLKSGTCDLRTMTHCFKLPKTDLSAVTRSGPLSLYSIIHWTLEMFLRSPNCPEQLQVNSFEVWRRMEGLPSHEPTKLDTCTAKHVLMSGRRNLNPTKSFMRSLSLHQHTVLFTDYSSRNADPM